MRRLFAVLILAPSLAMATFPRAWWLTTELAPVDGSYRGIEASALSVPLKAISPLSCTGFSQFSREQCAEVRANGLQFQLIGDFNNDGLEDIAEAAVAQLPSGTRVTALIISEKVNPRKNQVFVLEGNGFSVLRREGGTISWSPCMECGQISEISWDQGSAKYVEHLPEDYGGASSLAQRPLDGSA